MAQQEPTHSERQSVVRRADPRSAARARKGAVSEVYADDFCDDCGRPMPFTGDPLCFPCNEADIARRTCIVCGKPKVFLDDPTCSDRCDLELEGWPEP